MFCVKLMSYHTHTLHTYYTHARYTHVTHTHTLYIYTHTRARHTHIHPQQGYGTFIRPHNVQVGDFPERGIDDEEDDNDSDGDEI